MNPLGMIVATITKGTRVIDRSTGIAFIMPETITTALVARRNNTYDFLYKGIVYNIHAENVSYQQ